jgi:hypothetical protein
MDAIRAPAGRAEADDLAGMPVKTGARDDRIAIVHTTLARVVV